MTTTEFEQILLGGSGTRIITSATGSVLNLKGLTIQVLTDTVFLSISGKNKEGEVIDYFGDAQNWDWVTVPAGAILFAGVGNYIEKLQLSSGTIALNKA